MTGLRRATLSLALAALLAGCGNDSQSAEQPSPAVASSPSAGPTDGEIEPAEVGTATAEPATIGPTPTKHARHPSTPDPTAPTTQTGRVLLTLEDAGRTVTVRPGTVIVVELSGGPGSFHPPTTDATGVLRADSTQGGYPKEGPAVATFTAIGKGAAQITSTTDAACLHSEPACMIPQQQFLVTIRVSA